MDFSLDQQLANIKLPSKSSKNHMFTVSHSIDTFFQKTLLFTYLYSTLDYENNTINALFKLACLSFNNEKSTIFVFPLTITQSHIQNSLVKGLFSHRINTLFCLAINIYLRRYSNKHHNVRKSKF
uniref:Uncharacterized protein n=1 Tax=Cacopsylla melanoneura TaxID=428564 RepID=A0A8D9BI91_9HEMI